MLLLCCAIAAAVVVAAAVAADAPESPPAESSQKLQSLLNERRDTLRKLVDATESKYRSGEATLDSVLRASEQLLEAELDLAETKAERIAVREKLVANLRQREEYARGLHANGRATLESLLQVTAARLKAEIQLLRRSSFADCGNAGLTNGSKTPKGWAHVSPG